MKHLQLIENQVNKIITGVLIQWILKQIRLSCPFIS